jgi:hypothetical protein
LKYLDIRYLSKGFTGVKSSKLTESYKFNVEFEKFFQDAQPFLGQNDSNIQILLDFAKKSYDESGRGYLSLHFGCMVDARNWLEKIKTSFSLDQIEYFISPPELLEVPKDKTKNCDETFDISLNNYDPDIDYVMCVSVSNGEEECCQVMRVNLTAALKTQCLVCHCGFDKIRYCSRFGAAYCSIECQREDWPTHKFLCNPARKEPTFMFNEAKKWIFTRQRDPCDENIALMLKEMKESKKRGYIPVVAVNHHQTFKKLPIPLRIQFEIPIETFVITNGILEGVGEDRSVFYSPNTLTFVLLAFVPGKDVDFSNLTLDNSIQMKICLNI